jgi:hypothetical protein
MVMISAFLPVIFVNLPPVIRSHHIWALLWLFSVIVFKFKIFKERSIQFLFILGVIVLIVFMEIYWIDIEDTMRSMLISEFYEISVALSIFAYYRIENDYIGFAKLARLTIYCIVITAIMSIITSYVNPFFARDIVGMAILSGSEKEKVLGYERLGGGGYGFYSGLVCLFPILIYFFKTSYQSYWSKGWLLFFILLFYFCLLRVQFFANILIASLFIILGVISSKKIIRSLSWLLVFLSIIYLIPASYYIDFLKYIAGFFEKNSDVYMKFNDLAVFISAGGEVGVSTETGIRAERFPLLLDSFLSNPIFGGKYHNHHMFWMNKLAMLGLVGTIPFILVLVSYVRINVKTFDKLKNYYFLLSVFSIITLGFTKALFGKELWYIYFVIMPALYYTTLLKEKNKNSNYLEENEYI